MNAVKHTSPVPLLALAAAAMIAGAAAGASVGLAAWAIGMWWPWGS